MGDRERKRKNRQGGSEIRERPKETVLEKNRKGRRETEMKSERERDREREGESINSILPVSMLRLISAYNNAVVLNITQ